MTFSGEIESLKLQHVSCPMCNFSGGDTVARGRDFEYDTSPDEFEFFVCGQCGVLYLDPRPDTSELGRIYPEKYAPYHFDEKNLTLKVRSFLDRRKVNYFRRLLPAKADLLDGGCGGIGFLDKLRRFGPPTWRLWGNDIDESVLADLKDREFSVLRGRLEEIDLADGSFDAIFLRQVIEHLDSPSRVLSNTARLLTLGGHLVVETPNFEAWDAQIFQKRYWGGYHFPRHWTIFDPDTLSEAGARAGLHVESVSFLLSPSFWVQSIHHLLKDRGWSGLVYERFTHLNPFPVGAAVLLDLLQKTVTGRTSNMQIIFRKEDVGAESLRH